MTEMSNNHDRFFREVFSRPNWAQQFLTKYLPKPVARTLDLTTLHLRSGSFVDQNLREHFSDLLYQAQLNNGLTGYVYILFEHKSYPERLIAFQLLRYMVRIWEQTLKEEKRDKLPPIYPLVVYHGRQKWKIPLNFAALVDIPNEWYAYVPEFNYDLQELSDFVGEDITDNVPLQTALLAMKHVFDPKFAGELPELLDKYSVLAQEQAAMEFLMTTLRYIASASPYITQEDMRRAIEHAFPPTIGGNIMQTLAQEWVQQGIQQGVQQGVRQTLLENIKTGLELRFGEQGLVFYQKLNQSTDLAVLRSIFVALFKVAALDELQQTFNSSVAIAFRTAGQDQETNAN